MARSVPVVSLGIPRRNGDHAKDIDDCLCDDEDRTVVFPDRIIGRRAVTALQKEGELRHIQIVERLLAPLVAGRERHLASLLVRSFGGLGQALKIQPENIEDPDLSEACRIVHAAQKLAESAVSEQLSRSTVTTTDPRLIQYLRSLLAGPEEVFVAVFLDSEGCYLRDEALALGNICQVRMNARDLFSRAFQLSAKRLIIAHNHPSGDCRPSSDDIRATRDISEIGKMLDLALDDHLILSSSGYFSFKAGGLL